MPSKIVADADAALLYIRYSLPLTLDEIKTVIASNARKDHDSLTKRLHDFRGAKTDFDSKQMQALAGFVRSVRPQLTTEVREQRRLALIVSDDLSFGLGRMYGSLTDDEPGDLARARAFRSFDEASEWLGLPADYPDPIDRLA